MVIEEIPQAPFTGEPSSKKLIVIGPLGGGVGKRESALVNHAQRALVTNNRFTARRRRS